jgi:hypothetical protein
MIIPSRQIVSETRCFASRLAMIKQNPGNCAIQINQNKGLYVGTPPFQRRDVSRLASP